MLSSLKTALLLSVLCAPSHTSCLSLSSSSLCLRLSSPHQTRAQELLCGNHVYGAAVRRSGGAGGEDAAVADWDSLFRSAEFLSSSSSSSSSESRERRTSSSSGAPHSPANYRFLSQTKLRSKMLQQQNSVRGDRRSKFTLSLDVPTNIMNVLFDIAKAKSLRAKAADNARLLAQIGRRK